jgi:hypothetical protein
MTGVSERSQQHLKEKWKEYTNVAKEIRYQKFFLSDI